MLSENTLWIERIKTSYKGKRAPVSTLPRFARYEGSESHEILLSAPFLSSKAASNLSVHNVSPLQFIFGAVDLLLEELLTTFVVEAGTLLLVVEVELSSELSYLMERTGEACLWRNSSKTSFYHSRNPYALVQDMTTTNQLTKVHSK